MQTEHASSTPAIRRRRRYVEDPEDVPSVVATLRSVLADRGRLAEMQRTCRAVAVERYSLQAMCNGYWNVFTDLLKTPA